MNTPYLNLSQNYQINTRKIALDILKNPEKRNIFLAKDTENPNAVLNLMAMAAKPKQDNQKLSPEDEKELRTAVIDVWFGFAWLQWMDGKNLGAAWQGAHKNLVQIFVEYQNQENPAMTYVKEYANKHKKSFESASKDPKIANLMMNVPEDKKSEYKKIAENSLGKGKEKLKAKINEISARNPEFAKMQQQMQKNMMIMQMQYSRQAG